MGGVRLILALHDHQPVGNFDGVFESAYRDSYLPFLEVMEDYPAIPFVLHTSGPLVEWLVERHPDYIARVRALVENGRVEILGGGFFEPILTMIPHRDRVGQIRDFSAYLREIFGARVRGMWIPERVWEQHLVSALAEAGIEYTVLDDFHFQRTGLAEDDLFGYYLTEDEGQLVKVFPGSERLRYLVPFQEPHASYEYLRQVAARKPGATVVCADDGEKFGSWPRTFDHVYKNGWLRRFCDMIVGNREWLQPTTLARAVDQTLPLGKVYLPDSSYREMTEWVLPADRLAAFERAMKAAEGVPAAEALRPFARAGGFWRNFKAKYAETDEMYARMLEVSGRLAGAEKDQAADPSQLEIARNELYRGQCNCPYWHGAFGGLYLPHLRNAIYRHLIAADNALDAALGTGGPDARLEVGDFNLDARREVRIGNDRLTAYIRPAQGGHLYELDVRAARLNLLATLQRRPEPYHETIIEMVNGTPGQANGQVLKQEGLDRLLVYDRFPRKALVDHVYPLDVTLDDLASCRDVERGDFVTGTYLARTQRTAAEATLIMERPGQADGHLIQIRKTVRLGAGSGTIEVQYELEDLPEGRPIHFAVELNVAALAGHAEDRYYATPGGRRLGTLDSRLDRHEESGVALTDEWQDLSVALEWDRPGGLWCFPIQTVSQSEGGFEGVYQSSAVIPHWIVSGDESRRWTVALRWTVDRARKATAVEPAREARTRETVSAEA
jgi:hypothetical protein